MMQRSPFGAVYSLFANSVTKRNYQPVLNSLSKNVISAEYAVRGSIPLRGEEIMNVIEKGDGHKHY